MKSECRGCNSYNKENAYCEAGVPKTMEEYSCPCMTCIVKMICESSCKDFKKYVNTFVKKTS